MKLFRIYGIIVIVAFIKRSVNCILNKQIKYYTKEGLKLISIVGIALFIIITIILLKFDIAVRVSISGEEIGYVKNKKAFEEKIQNEVLKTENAELESVELAEEPQYKLTFLSKVEDTNEDEIIAKIENDATRTYVRFAVTIDNNQEAILEKLEDAESLVDEMEEKYGKKRKIGIKKVYSINNEEYQPVSVKTARNEVTDAIETQIEKEEEEQRRKEQSINGIYLAVKPVSGVITSRFGNRESIRSYAHRGLDIAAPGGTPIKAAASGKVIWSGYKGSYGNLVKIDSGKGVVAYYGHCSKLYVSAGEQVKAGDVIATVGSTGNSTGNHLHFEIQLNGQCVNPQKYLYK
ncbi:peptidase M23 [Clostridium sp. CAG:273]|nr:peptidase M23 [Clostridium sp. CAG:273]